MAEIFFLNNHIWLCAAVVSHSQPQSKWLRPFFYKTLKRFQKKPVFGHFWKSQWVKLAKYYLKSTTRQYWIWISFYFYWKTLFLTYFLVYCKFLLYQAGTIVYPFIVVLKHKWELSRTLIVLCVFLDDKRARLNPNKRGSTPLAKRGNTIVY